MTRYLLFFALLVGSCGNDIKTASFNLPEQATHQLKQRFRISEPVEGTFFTNIRNIHILEDGNVVAQNYPDYQLYELNPEGKLVNVIGREGRGPGEFIETFSSYLMSNDSLHVYDVNNRRHQVFIKKKNSWEHIRERVFKNAHIPGELFGDLENGYYGTFRKYPGLRDTLSASYSYVARVDHNVERAGEGSRLRKDGDVAIHRDHTKNSMTTSVKEHFFRAYYQYDPVRDEVIYIKNTSNEIIAIDSSGREQVKGHLPFERFQIKTENMERSLENVNYYHSGMEEIVRGKLLPHEPYYWNVVLVGDGLWVQLARSEPDKPNWVITTLKGDILKSFHGANGLRRIKIRGTRLYGVEKDSLDITYLVGYELTK